MNAIVDIFKDLSKITLTSRYILASIVILAVLLVIARPKKKLSTKAIVYGGLCVSIAFVLSYIRLYRWPQGGSITLASMLPMFVYAYIFGPAAGIAVGASYGLLQLIQDPYVLHPAQVLLDYFLAFAGLGLAGFSSDNLSIGIMIGGFGRFFSSFLSGVIFFGSYAPEGMSSVVYSLSLNGLIIGTDALICLLVSLLPQVRGMIEQLKKGVYEYPDIASK